MLFCFAAIQKAVDEWKNKKSQRRDNEEEEEEEEENIYAVEKDVSANF